jgi:hypothetical protein
MKKRGNRKERTIVKNRNGQVWVETVVYLLIAFAMMGLVLSFVKPKIEEMRDKTIIEQSLGIIKEIDNTIITIGSPGNKRLLEIGIRKGSLIIDCEKDIITFEMDSKYGPSEVGEPVQTGNIVTLTEGTEKAYKVTLKRDFSKDYDFSYGNQEISKSLSKASNPYRLFLTNKGESSNKVLIDFSIE